MNNPPNQQPQKRSGFWQTLLGGLFGAGAVKAADTVADAFGTDTVANSQNDVAFDNNSPQQEQHQGVEVDLNQDGHADAIAFDDDHDGHVDKLMSDANHDGYVDEVAVDSDHDGDLDSVFYDKNEDGQYESSAHLQQDVVMNLETQENVAQDNTPHHNETAQNDEISKDEFDPNADVSEWTS